MAQIKMAECKRSVLMMVPHVNQRTFWRWKMRSEKPLQLDVMWFSDQSLTMGCSVHLVNHIKFACGPILNSINGPDLLINNNLHTFLTCMPKYPLVFFSSFRFFFFFFFFWVRVGMGWEYNEVRLSAYFVKNDIVNSHLQQSYL